MLYKHLRKLQTRFRHVFFGPPYQSADHAALSPRGTPKQMLLIVGGLWAALFLFDFLNRFPWSPPKSLRYMQGVRVLSEPANLHQQPYGGKGSGYIERMLKIDALNALYNASDTPAHITTDAYGFRQGLSKAPFELILSGDSYFTNDVLADTLARVTGLAVGDAAINGQGVLSMARLLDEPSPLFRSNPKIVVWGRGERDISKYDMALLPEYRQKLQPQANPLKQQYKAWQETALWPSNAQLYLTETSPLTGVFTHWFNELKWYLYGEHDSNVVLGRTDLPSGVVPMQFLMDEKSLRTEIISDAELNETADAIAVIHAEWRQRGTVMFFTMPPEKSAIYPERLPVGLAHRPGFAQRLYVALRRRGVPTIDLTVGLRQAALRTPSKALYYSSDTHWNEPGVALAAHIMADSLTHNPLTSAIFGAATAR